MKIMCVYKISSKLKPNRFYIGSTTNYSQRKSVHIYRLKNNVHHSKRMQSHFNKYGLDDLSIEIIKNIELHDQLLSTEQYFIDTLKPLFNGSPTAKSTYGIKLKPRTAEHSRKISEATKGKIISEETRQLRRKKIYKYSIDGVLIATYNSLTEASVIEKTCLCISSQRCTTSHGFVWVSDLSKIPNFAALKERLKKAETQVWKPVLQFDRSGNILSEYDSAREAWRQTGVSTSKISLVANGKRETAGGFVWKFKTLQNVA